MEEGIDSVSLNPDALLKTLLVVAEAEGAAGVESAREVAGAR